jgi:hypothetical protein
MFVNTPYGRVTISRDAARAGLFEMRQFHSLCHGIGRCVYDSPHYTEEGLVTDAGLLICKLAPIILAGLTRVEDELPQEAPNANV